MNDTANAPPEIGVTDWLLVDQQLINNFADATHDHQYIHVDPARAKESPFGTTIAHGLLTLSLLPHFIGCISTVEKGSLLVNYGFDRVRFISPVKSGSEVRARFTRIEVTERSPGQKLIKLGVTVEIKAQEKPAMSAEWLVLTDADT